MVIEGCAVTVVMLVKVTITVTSDGPSGATTDGVIGCGVTEVVPVTVTCTVLDSIVDDTAGDDVGVALGMIGDPELSVCGSVVAIDVDDAPELVGASAGGFG